MKTSLAVILLLASASACMAGSVGWTFDLLPGDDTAVDAAPGGTAGWGYTITNNSPQDFLVLGSFSPDPIPDTSSTNALFDYPILAPGATVTEDYIPGTQGAYEFTWLTTAPALYTATGDITVGAEWFDSDPSLNPDAVDLGSAGSQTAGFIALVNNQAPVSGSSPEPSAFCLMACGLVGLGLRFRRTAPPAEQTAAMAVPPPARRRGGPFEP